MSDSSKSGQVALPSQSKPRIVRGAGPKRKSKHYNYREVALPELRRDFTDRCAYSMQHLEFGGGEKCMEVDHFDCTLSKSTRNRYENLFLASRHCNGSKSDVWPSPAEQKLGMRFLNCCEEEDYGAVIFEDPDTHEVWGTTVAARYHVLHCDLNRDHLVKERARRAKILADMQRAAMTTDVQQLRPLLSTITETVDKMIPLISYRSKPQKSAVANGSGVTPATHSR